MSKEAEKTIYHNRADFNKKEGKVIATDQTVDENFSEELVFAMKDSTHNFSIGLTTILGCLSIAEEEGYLPPLPEGWWSDIRQF